MKLALLGTGDALRTPRVGCACDTCKGASFGTAPSRTSFSILVDNGIKGKVIIDASPDLRGQLLKAAISRINAIPWTHPHYDYYAGFGELAWTQGEKDVYGIHEILDSILSQFH
jgi:phosphoribosyl 1,2-cyclic phosphate phosphodiesterase